MAGPGASQQTQLPENLIGWAGVSGSSRGEGAGLGTWVSWLGWLVWGGHVEGTEGTFSRATSGWIWQHPMWQASWSRPSEISRWGDPAEALRWLWVNGKFQAGWPHGRCLWSAVINVV